MLGGEAFTEALETHGAVRTPAVVPAGLCEEARAAWLDEVRGCEEPLLRQLSARLEPHEVGPDGLVLNPLQNPHRLGDRFPRFAAIPSAILETTRVAELAALAVGGPCALVQSAFYESAHGTAAHRDEHPLDPEAPMVGAWIALEPIALESGPFLAWPGTHRIADPELARASRASWAARFVEGRPDPERDAEVARLLGPHLGPAHAFLLDAGDVVWWRRDTVHGSLPPTPGSGRSRISLILHFAPRTEPGQAQPDPRG